IGQAHESGVYGLRLFLAAMRLPQRAAIVQVVRNDHAMFFRRLHCFLGDQRSGFRQGREYPTGVKPAAAIFGEDTFPVDFTRLQLRDCSVSSIGATYSRPQAKAAFGEVQTIADAPSYAVVRDPLQVG